MTRIRLDFCDFWPGFSKTENYFYETLSKRYQIELTDKPDFLICSEFGHHQRLFTCAKIFFSGESTGPDFSKHDYAFTSHYVDDPRHLRLPLYPLYMDARSLIKPPDFAERVLAESRKFCSFVVSNPKNKERIDFFQKLNARMPVDSGGRYLNNIGGPVEDKNTFLGSYRFNIAFENKSQPGYTTEKIVQPMQTGCLPIYWGNPLIAREFNPKSFINLHDFPSHDAAIERILEIAGNRELYAQYLREPWFHGNTPNEFFDRERVLNQFKKIFSTKITPVSQRRSLFGRWTLLKKDRSPKS
jgi:hypothetical protein